jgi:hypothetical protein
MRLSLLFKLVITLTVFMVLPHGFAQQGQGVECPACQVSFATAEDLAETIADILGVDPAAVLVEPGEAPGTFRVTLPDGSDFSVAPVGPIFRHQNMVQRRLLQTGEGRLALRSRTRSELQLRSAVHREAAVIAEMLSLGWTDFYWLRHGMEVESPTGTRYCFQPDMQVFSRSPPAAIQIDQDADGNLVVIHTDGIRQRLHGCAHDFAQLRDRAREEVQQQLVMDPDGIFVLDIEGEPRRFRLAAALRWSGVIGQPGFVPEGNRIHLRYRDGWEQEIVELP